MDKIERMMSPRMIMVAGAVEPCRCVFDTGSDHAFVPIYLVEKHICLEAVASDVRDGPIEVSLRNIKQFGFSERIRADKGFGIERASGSDCIIIAGMGGLLITEILERNKDIAKAADQLVLQPMNAPEKLRKYLWDEGFDIKREDLCSEKHRVYNVICAEFKGGKEQYETWQLHASKYLAESGHDLLPGYLAPKLRRLHAMRKGTGGNDLELKELIERLEEIYNANI